MYIVSNVDLENEEEVIENGNDSGSENIGNKVESNLKDNIALDTAKSLFINSTLAELGYASGSAFIVCLSKLG